MNPSDVSRALHNTCHKHQGRWNTGENEPKRCLKSTTQHMSQAPGKDNPDIKALDNTLTTTTASEGKCP
ncbi:hypothetical protein J6590_027702 [Homalodisca vitripennis]|nr:hypothetical protein J6590_027702 [Homalodisca vitripennis]